VLRNFSALTTLALAAALAVGGCGGSDDSSGESGAYGSGGGGGGSTQKATAGGPSASGDGVVAVGKGSDLGPILVDSKGFTLYDFHKDKGGQSACYDACAATWPPLTTEGAPKAMSGAQSAQLGTTKRKDGAMQVTYAGHPLYTYAVDSKPGDTKGQDIDSFGAEWYALQPSGAEAED
jgi:predicted lipoprotein with Yx(FWY)xxD motif